MRTTTFPTGLYLMGLRQCEPPMKAIAITQANDRTAAIRNCLRYDPTFLYEVFMGDFCDTIDSESLGRFFAEHTEWASLYLTFNEQYPDAVSILSPVEVFAPVAAFPVEMLAYILQHGNVYEPTVFSLADLPLLNSQVEPPLPHNMWLLYDDVETTTVEVKLVTAWDETTAHRKYVEAGIASREYLETIVAGKPWSVLSFRPTDTASSQGRTRKAEERVLVISELRSFFAEHTDWVDMYLAHHTARDLSLDVVASFPREMLLYTYEEDRGRWLFSIDLGTIPFTAE